MRTAFVNKLIELARRDERIWLVTGDLGFSVFEGFIAEFPDRYLNVGVAEQNMIGVAAGLALSGIRPFVYSISTFATMRAYEQIRNDICYQNLPVVIIGGGSTFSYSTFGATHMPLEDVGIMRQLPNMRVCVPGDPYEVGALLELLYENEGPAYMRIAKKGEPVVHGSTDVIKYGEMSVVREGNDGSILVTGRQLVNAVSAADILAKEEIHVRVLSVHTVKPFDAISLTKAAQETSRIITVEEHSLIGGLASATLEALRETKMYVPIKSLGVPDIFPSGVGSQDYFLNQYGLNPEGIAEAVRSLL